MVVAPSSSSLNLFIVGLVFLLVVPRLFLHVSCKAGFSVELMHRDSPKSHPASTPLSLLNSSIRRSASYAGYLRTANPGNANSPLVCINNEGCVANPGNANSPQVSIRKNGASARITSYYSYYVVSFKIGYNKHIVSAVLEVADDFTWLFCHPCPSCPAGPPIFDPEMSGNTYLKLGCDHKFCDLFEEHNCDDQRKCHFSHKYYPGTANGTLSEDRVTIRTTKKKGIVYLKNVTFGCINAIKGKHFEHSMGVLGLGSGELSLISQMAMQYGKKFSYCLPSNEGSRSNLKFGVAAKADGIMRIAALDSSDHPFHKINLTRIYSSTDTYTLPTDNNIVISTSIFYTFIEKDSLQFILREVKKRVHLPEIPHERYHLCYDTTNFAVNLMMPEITLIFRKNAQLVLKEDNAFVSVDNALCLAILSNELTSGTSVLGSLAHKGHLMLFDVDEGNLRFSDHNNRC